MTTPPHQSNHVEPPRNWPSEGRLAGIDFGTVRIGIAVSDPSRQWVSPLETYQRRSAELDAQYFQALIAAERITGWVIGLPIHCDGKESEKSQQARAFGKWLSEQTDIPHRFFDERFTTAEARRLLQSSDSSGKKKKQKLDGVAAHLILTHYLESSSESSPTAAESQNEALEDKENPS